MFSAGIAMGIGNGFESAFGLEHGATLYGSSQVGAQIIRAGVHGISRAIIGLAQGSKFKSGFASGFASALFSPGASLGGRGTGGFTMRTTIASVVGGTASELGGGKFSNGAVSGAFVHMFNAEGDWWDLKANHQAAKRIAHEELKNRPNSHNDLGDAMRHAEWNRRMASEINEFTALYVGVGHEVVDNLLPILWDNLTNGMNGGFYRTWQESMMDLHNNYVGRHAGVSGSNININKLRVSPDFRVYPYGN